MKLRVFLFQHFYVIWRLCRGDNKRLSAMKCCSHKLNSALSRIQTWNLVIWSGALTSQPCRHVNTNYHFLHYILNQSPDKQNEHSTFRIITVNGPLQLFFNLYSKTFKMQHFLYPLSSRGQCKIRILCFDNVTISKLFQTI